MQQQKMTRTEIRTMYSQKKAAVRIHYTNLHKRSSREPRRKETTEEKLEKKKEKEKKKKKKKKITNTCNFFQQYSRTVS